MLEREGVQHAVQSMPDQESVHAQPEFLTGSALVARIDTRVRRALRVEWNPHVIDVGEQIPVNKVFDAGLGRASRVANRECVCLARLEPSGLDDLGISLLQADVVGIALRQGRVREVARKSLDQRKCRTTRYEPVEDLARPLGRVLRKVSLVIVDDFAAATVQLEDCIQEGLSVK